jgi:hypothetical protein
MNKRYLTKSIWQQCKLRPHVIGFATPPDRVPRGRLGRLDDTWIIMPAEGDAIELRNSTGHFIVLPTDNVVEYRKNLSGQPPFLILKSQIYMTRNKIIMEPIPNWRPQQNLADTR